MSLLRRHFEERNANNFSSHENLKLKVFHIFLYSVNAFDISLEFLNWYLMELYFLENTLGIC